MTSHTMGEPVTQGQFFERMQQSDDKHLDAHRRLRDSLEEMRKELSVKMDAHAADDAHQFKALGDSVLVMQTERAGEKAQAVKRATLISLVAAGGLTGLLEALKHWAGWK